MRVLHVFKTYFPDTHGGVEQVIYQLAEGGARHGIESHVFSLSPRGAAREERMGHHMTHRARQDVYVASTGLSLSAVREFRALVPRMDVVHYHFPWPFMDLLHLVRGTRRPSLVTYHSDIVKQRLLLHAYRPLMRHFLGSMDCIVASSPNYATSSPELVRLADKVRVIPFGLDRATYPPPDARRLAAWRERLGPRFFLFVGGLRYYKGLDYLLEAVRGTDVVLAICGGGAAEADLQRQAEGAGAVHFLGALDDEDKNALLALCEAFVLPSHLRSEAFGVSLLEAAMAGKPLICCEIGTGTTYINRDGETGLVVPPADASALRAALLRLWHDPALGQRLGEGARARFDAVFSGEAMVTAYADLYRELAAR